jgi:D-tyrosyl-tRNA(Tyr) deacylase
MRAVLQRVTRASVTVGDEVTGQIERGLVVLLGVEQDDTDADAHQLADKTIQLRIFDDADGKMNLALPDVGGSVLVVSQFTLLGDCRKGRRPSFIQAAAPELAERLYETFVAAIGVQGIRVATGRFRAMMQVELVNDGPVTIMLDSRKRF